MNNPYEYICLKTTHTPALGNTIWQNPGHIYLSIVGNTFPTIKIKTVFHIWPTPRAKLQTAAHSLHSRGSLYIDMANAFDVTAFFGQLQTSKNNLCSCWNTQAKELSYWLASSAEKPLWSEPQMECSSPQQSLKPIWPGLGLDPLLFQVLGHGLEGVVLHYPAVCFRIACHSVVAVIEMWFNSRDMVHVWFTELPRCRRCVMSLNW